MTNEIQTLQDLAHLASRRYDGKRGRALEREAQNHDLVLSRSTFDSMLAARYTSIPKRETVDPLAYLAHASTETAYQVAGLPIPQTPLADQLPPDVDTLPPEQRRVLIDMARVLVNENRQVHDMKRKAGDGDGKATPLTDAGSPSATSEADWLGSFEGRTRGDLDHKSVNDGAGDNAQPLTGERRKKAYDLRAIEELQKRGDSTTDEEIQSLAADDLDEGGAE